MKYERANNLLAGARAVISHPLAGHAIVMVACASLPFSVFFATLVPSVRLENFWDIFHHPIPGAMKVAVSIAVKDFPWLILDAAVAFTAVSANITPRSLGERIFQAAKKLFDRYFCR